MFIVLLKKYVNELIVYFLFFFQYYELKKILFTKTHEHNFPQMKIGGLMHRFNPKWFKEYGSWLEYSIENDAAYCLYCYLQY